MSTKTKITYAYCLNLNRNVTIDEAYNESTATVPSRIFKFSCIDSRCRDRGVEITAVGYDKLPSQRKVSCHFKQHSSPLKKNHHPDCELIQSSTYNEFHGTYHDETNEEAHLRRSRHKKLNDLIDIYIPINKNNSENNTSPQEKIDKPDIQHTSFHNNLKKPPNNASNLNKTSSLSRFVRHYHQMTKKLTPDELNKTKVNIRGLGSITYPEYFQFFPLVWNDTSFSGIQHGKIKTKYIKKYGSGFKLFFLGKINKKTVSIYISPEQINQYRNRNEILDIINKSDSFSSITAYFITDTYGLMNDSYQIILDDLSNLVLIADTD